MSTNEGQKKGFYLVSVDVIQGFFLFVMMFGHGIHWWDKSILHVWDTPDYIFTSIFTFGLFILTAIGNTLFPFFLFLYGFNNANSLVRKAKTSNWNVLRERLILKSLFFAIFGSLLDLGTAILLAPDKLLNFLFTWHIFHMFAFTGVFLLFIFELSRWLEKSKVQTYLEHRQRLVILFLVSLICVLVVFLVFHEYSSTEELRIYTNLNLIDILKFAFLDAGQCPVIPWLSFGLTGALVASFFDLAHAERKIIGKRSIIVGLTGLIFSIPGFFLLTIENFDQPHTFYRASSSLVIITIGMMCLVTTILLRLLDFNSIYSEKKVNKFLYPFVVISNITFTVYLVHQI
ncbi:MAG: hypothetical protein ACFFBD_23985, partial [Candidatus Hodarchaeota archaeon]